MMMDVRELVTKFSFQVNSEAVTKFVSLLKEAETSLDNLGKKTTVNAGKARVEGEKRTQRQIDAIQSKWDKRRSDRLKIATRKQQKADKEQLDYEERRSKVLSARDLSRIKRRIKAEETANKLIAKQQEEANKKADKEQLAYETRRSKVLSARDKQRSDRRALAIKQEQLLRDIRSSNVDFDRAFKPKPSFLPKETENVGLPDLFGKTEKSLSKELDALLKPMAKFQNKVADNQIKVEKKTQEKIADIQKRWDDRRFNRQLKNIRSSNVDFDRAFKPKPSFLPKETENVGLPDLFSKTEKSLSKELDALFKPMAKEVKRTEEEALAYNARRSKVLQRHSVSRLKRRIRNAEQPTPTGGGGGGFSLADTYFNVQLLKDAYQLFYNIAEATRQTAVNILRTNDALSMSIAKIGVITGDTKNASKNFKELLDISAETGSEIGVIEEIFNRLSMGKEGLGATTDQIIDFTSAIAKMSAFSEGGAAQQGALRQLGQMFGGTYIQAQEWNSIVDGLPMVASKIAKAMGTTREAMTFKIRQQTKDSPAYLISDIFPKLLKILPEIEAEFNNLPPTLNRTLNKAGVGLLKFSLNLKESVKMPELDAFYSRLDGTIQKIFEWADANKALIGTNINSFFGTLGDVLGSVDTQLKDTKGSAIILNDTFYILNQTVKFIKGTFDALLWTLQQIKPLMEWMQQHPTATNVTVGAGGGAIIGGRVAGPTGAGVGAAVGGLAGFIKSQNDKAQPMINQINKYNAEKNLRRLQGLKQGKSIDQINKEEIPFYHNFGRSPQSIGTKGGGVTVVQNNTFNGNSATPSQQKQTARMVHPATGNAVSTAIQKRSVGH